MRVLSGSRLGVGTASEGAPVASHDQVGVGWSWMELKLELKLGGVLKLVGVGWSVEVGVEVGIG